mgnify:CR=1 FL=1
MLQDFSVVLEFDLFSENINLANNFLTESAMHTNIFLAYDLDIGVNFDLFFINFNLANNFSAVSARVFIFHMNIPCDKIFLLVLNHLTLTFAIFLKKKKNVIQEISC